MFAGQELVPKLKEVGIVWDEQDQNELVEYTSATKLVRERDETKDETYPEFAIVDDKGYGAFAAVRRVEIQL